MAIKVLSKTDIPDWEYGDVAIKTFSYGESLDLSDMMEEEGGKLKVKPSVREADVNLFTLAAGLLYIKKADGSGFIFNTETDISDKKKFLYKINLSSAQKLLEEIKILNEPISKEQKKN